VSCFFVAIGIYSIFAQIQWQPIKSAGGPSFLYQIVKERLQFYRAVG
jgi:hypothetical protein